MPAVAAEFMARYTDTPMDFADATLVLTPGHLGCGDILTSDEHGAASPFGEYWKDNRICYIASGNESRPFGHAGFGNNGAEA